MLQSVSAATDLDLISYLKAIPDARMRRGCPYPGLVPSAGSGARRHHAVLTEALGIELKRPPSDSAFRYFFLQVDVAAVCAAIRDWTIAQIACGASDLDQRLPLIVFSHQVIQ